MRDALEECLEEDLSFVPPEREIMRTHRFSESFENGMKELLEERSRQRQESEIRKHFCPRYGQWAACILIFCVCGVLLYSLVTPLMNQLAKSGEKGETADLFLMEEESAVEDTATAEGGDENAAASQEEAVSKMWNGREVTLALRQEVPEFLDYVTTLVNCPVQDEENPVLCLTIGNIGEEDIRYRAWYDLEVWLEDGWYVIPHATEPSGEWLDLEAGMAVDEVIDLEEYELDYDASRYRLITYVNDDRISAEFTFEEVFSQQMEKLEGETSGE